MRSRRPGRKRPVSLSIGRFSWTRVGTSPSTCCPTMSHRPVSPTDVDHVLCTHCHIDHLLGLPGLLAANRKRASVRSNAPPLRLYGPRDMAAACEAATAMLQVDRLPPTIPEYEVHCVTPGETVSIGEISVQVDGPSTPLTRAATASTTVPAALASSSPETRLTTRGWQPLPKDTTCSSMTHVRMATPPPRTCR